MEICKIENLTFKYPAAAVNALDDISVSVKDGEFITVCGKSGCGKSTLLRELKPVLSPHGEKSGIVYFKGQEITEIDFRIQSGEIGFVGQDPDNRIVTDKVWHELAFGAESLGMPSEQIRVRVAEMASFFGIETWFHKSTSELSGGQKQLLNLASVMVMQPSLLLLDEPASQLDPIAAHEFLQAVSKINRELGITVILTEHRLEEAFAISDRVLVMDNGRIIADGAPSEIGGKLKGNDMFFALPAAMRIYGEVDGGGKYPVTVREGREWLMGVSANSELIKEKEYPSRGECVVEVENAYFRYEKNLPDVIRNLSMSVCKGEIYAVMGGNGTGKSTMLSLISGIFRAYRGEVKIEGKPVLQVSDLYRGCMGVLPQNPQSLFVKKIVFLDLSDALPDKAMTAEEREEAVKAVSELCGLDGLLERHPYDLSGGEQQRAALAKVLLTKPRILLLDEPTKGLDAHFKRRFAAILKNLTASGVTVIMVSHDIEFCAEYADRCAMFFDGNIVSEGTPREFFADNSFYTTASNRMARNLIENAVLAEDIIRACGKETEHEEPIEYKTERFAPRPLDEPKKIKKPKIIRGIVFAALFLVSLAFVRADGWISSAAQFLSILFLGISLDGFIPQKELGGAASKGNRKLTKRTALSAAMGIIAVPITMYVGIYFLGDRKYYFISLLIVIETLIPFFAAFEQRKPQARELVVISVLCAVAVAGRAALYMLPQFKPVIAIVIIAAVCFGAETGFLTGAVTGFVSNFFAGQGPWTPWQMFAFGIIGFLAGVLFQKGFLRRTRGSLCIFGGLATVFIYGVILNISSAIMAQESLNAAVILSYCAMGLPFDIIHAAATVFFLWTASVPMIEKFERIKTKYGIIGG